MYILIIINTVYGGGITTTQEFMNKQSCENSIYIINEKVKNSYSYSSSRGPTFMICVPKGDESK